MGNIQLLMLISLNSNHDSNFLLRTLNQHHHEAEVLKAEASAVYYPIVGFTFVKGCEDALPTISNASIRMPTTSQKKQDVYGWYSTSCKLDLCTEDENVCHNPSTEVDTASMMI